MGQGTDALTPQSPERIEREIHRLRGDLSSLLDEVDRRRHELLNWRVQVRRRKRGFALAGGGLVTVAALASMRRRKLRSPEARRARLRSAVERMVEKPERVAKPSPSFSRKIGASVLAGVAATMAKRATTRGLERRRAR